MKLALCLSICFLFLPLANAQLGEVIAEVLASEELETYKENPNLRSYIRVLIELFPQSFLKDFHLFQKMWVSFLPLAFYYFYKPLQDLVFQSYGSTPKLVLELLSLACTPMIFLVNLPGHIVMILLTPVLSLIGAFFFFITFPILLAHSLKATLVVSLIFSLPLIIAAWIAGLFTLPFYIMWWAISIPVGLFIEMIWIPFILPLFLAAIHFFRPQAQALASALAEIGKEFMEKIY